MKKLNLKGIWIFAVIFFMFPTFCVRAEEKIEIEQVITNMPSVEMYVRSGEMPDKNDLEVRLLEELLTVDNIQLYSEKNEGTDYFVLVDISNSMPDGYCKEIKSALSDFMDTVSEKDRVILMSFGEEVTTLLKGNESTDERKQAVEKLDNKDRKTLMFEAIMQTADLADELKSDNRKIVLVFSDGEDFAVGASTSEEASKALAERNMPVYALGIKDTAKENLNAFGEFARGLGGNLNIFSAKETGSVLQTVIESINNTWVIELSAKNNYINHQMNVISLKIPSTGITRSKEVMLGTSTADSVAPTIVNVEKVEVNQLKVTFSEAVTGGEFATSWSIFAEEKNLPVVTATYESDSVVLLTFEEDLYTGHYKVEAPGLTDNSMEKNSVTTAFEMDIDGVKPTPKWLVFIKEWLWLICVVLVIVLLLVVVLVWSKIKKNKGIVYVDGKAALASNISQRQRVSLSDEPGFAVSLEIVSGLLGEGNVIQTTIYKSLIVGRASFCDLSLEDGRMSRQHFALEHKDGEVFITDLQTTNGTFVNGVRVYNDHKLHSGDVIVAGSLKMKIMWS